MEWQTVPMGMMRHDELLNALLAIWKIQHNMACRNGQNHFSGEYLTGFEEALEAVAQATGLSDAFEEGRISHQAGNRAKFENLEVVDSQATVLDAF